MKKRAQRHGIAPAVSRTSARWLPFVASAVAILVHASYVPRGFTWLDHGDVVAGRAVLPLARLHEAFVTRMGDTGFFRPMAVVLHSLHHALYGAWAPGYHLTSVLLHALIVAVTPFFLRAFVRLAPREECLAALVVAVHPLSWLVAGGVTYQQELLVTLFTLAAVGFHAHARRSGRRMAAVMAAACVTLGALSKETALFWVPAWIGLWEIYGRHDGEAKRWPRLWASYAAGLAAGLVARAHAVPEVWRSTAPALSMPEWIGLRARALARTLAELVTPWPPSTNDTAVIGPPGILETVVVLSAASVAVWVLLRHGTSPAGRLLWVLALALAPALRLVPVSRFGSPHYTFPAAAALGGLLVLALRAVRPASARTLAAGTAVAWLMVSAVFTAAGGARFTDDVALFEPELRRDPVYPEAHAELGRYWLSRGEAARATSHLEAALQPPHGRIAYVDRTMAQVNLALALASAGRAAEAEWHLAAAREGAAPSQRPLIDYNRAVVAAGANRDAEVVELLGPHEGSWTSHEPPLLLARALGRLGRLAEARRALEIAERLAAPSERPAIERLRRSVPVR